MDWARGLLPRCGAVGTRLAQLTLPNKSTPLTESGTSMARPSPQGTASTSRRCHCAEGAAFVVRAAAQARRHADVNTLVGGTRNPGELPRSSAPRSVRHPSAERAEARKGEGGRIVAHTLQARNPIVLPHTQALPTCGPDLETARGAGRHGRVQLLLCPWHCVLLVRYTFPRPTVVLS